MAAYGGPSGGSATDRYGRNRPPLGAPERHLTIPLSVTFS